MLEVGFVADPKVARRDSELERVKHERWLADVGTVNLRLSCLRNVDQPYLRAFFDR